MGISLGRVQSVTTPTRLQFLPFLRYFGKDVTETLHNLVRCLTFTLAGTIVMNKSSSTCHEH